jgi:very-short-patch-repair endonuclease
VAAIKTVAEAARAGISWNELQAKRWRRVGPGQYAPSKVDDGPLLRLKAVALRLPPGAAFGGPTAAWLNGLDLPPCSPIEVVATEEVGVSARSGVIFRRIALETDEVVIRQGFRTTSVQRTLADLAWRLGLADAVTAIDEALHKGLVAIPALEDYSERRRGRKGARRFRRALSLAEQGAESPMETRLRLLLVLAGLPKPELQASILSRAGEPIARADLYYPTHRLVIEYDGSTHKDSIVEDSRRQNRLIAAGCSILRFTAADVRGNPDSVVAQVKRALMDPPANE